MLEFVTPRWPAPPNIQALCTTRTGGISVGKYSALNLATHVGDDPTAVNANRARLQTELPLPSAPRWLTQVHGTTLVNAAHVAPLAADAAYADTRETVCAILTADCLPILICDTAGENVIAIHAGWRGLAEGIIARTFATLAMRNTRWLAWIGPGISAENYAVGDDVRAIFQALDPSYAQYFVAAGLRWQMDLQAIARAQLASAGVEAIAHYDGCTFGEPTRFFSYRRDGETGRMASLIWIT